MRLKDQHILFALLAVAFFLFLADTSFTQCSMCRKIATDGSNSKSVGAGLNTGILYLLGLPYFLIAFFFRKQIMDFARGFMAKR